MIVKLHQLLKFNIAFKTLLIGIGQCGSKLVRLSLSIASLIVKYLLGMQGAYSTSALYEALLSGLTPRLLARMSSYSYSES